MLAKNLEALRSVNASLANKLEKTELSDKTVLFLSPGDQVNMAYEGAPLHQIEDPIGEARNICLEQLQEDDDFGYQCIVFIFGLGLGYLLRRTYVECKAHIIVFEPHLEILRQTLEVIDFSDELKSGRVQIVNDIAQVLPSIGTHYMVGDRFRIMYLPSYQEVALEQFAQVLHEIKSSIYYTSVGQNTVLMKMHEFARGALQNMGQVLQYPDASIVHEQFKGKPGVVISAGPSLDKPGVIETLKEIREHIIISTIGQAARALDKVGIVPDFISVVENVDVSTQMNDLSYVDQVNLVLLPQAHKNVWDLPVKRKMVAFSGRDPMTFWLTDVMQKPLFGYAHQGTVSISALNYLIYMGCNPIFMLGQDLAYPAGQMYSSGSIYAGKKLVIGENGEKSYEWEDREKFFELEGFIDTEQQYQYSRDRMTRRLIEVKGWEGETMYTEPAYETYRKAFEQIRRRVPQDKIIVNCSVGGAHIEGYEHLPFPEAIEKYAVAQSVIERPPEQLLAEIYEDKCPPLSVVDDVHARFAEDQEKLELLLHYTSEGNEVLDKAFKELRNKKVISHSMQSRLRKLEFYDAEISRLTQENMMINSFIQKALFEYTRKYKRKLTFENGDQLAGDVKELEENLDNTKMLYDAIEQGAKDLMEAIDLALAGLPAPADPLKKTPILST